MWVLTLVIAIILLWVYDRLFYREFRRVRDEAPGPRGVPILGNALLFARSTESRGIFKIILRMWKDYGNIFRLTIFRNVGVVISGFQDAEIVLSSNSLLDKGPSYEFITPWVGYGLLTSTGHKWKSQRKLLTPAFHFQILIEFLDIFNKNGSIMCEKLIECVGNPPFDVYQYVKLMALQNIYETAMGVNMEVQSNPDLKYVTAVKNACLALNIRAFVSYLRPEWLFRFSSLYKMQCEAIECIHKDTDTTIIQKREELKGSSIRKDGEDKSDYSIKKRFAFLDLLLLQEDENRLTTENIRDEVNTFMFEGHDTITSALSFILYTLAQHQDVQDRVYNEQLEIFGDADPPITNTTISDMKYLDMVIKECQRLYPSVPFIERKIIEDVVLSNGVKLHKDCGHVTVFIYALHRDPEVWPEPEKFNPDNFLPEAAVKRNPYAYVPFSAGPRNCIGQRFAMLEMKCTLSKIVRQFRLLPSNKPEHKLKMASEVVLVSKSGWHVRLENRK